MRSVLAEQVVALFGRYPRLVAAQIADISDFISNIRHVTQDENLFIHMVSKACSRRIKLEQHQVGTRMLSYLYLE